MGGVYKRCYRFRSDMQSIIKKTVCIFSIIPVWGLNAVVDEREIAAKSPICSVYILRDWHSTAKLHVCSYEVGFPCDNWKNWFLINIPVKLSGIHIVYLAANWDL